VPVVLYTKVARIHLDSWLKFSVQTQHGL